MSTTDSPPTVTDHDRLAARRLVDEWVAVRTRGTHLGPHGISELVGRIATMRAEARAEALRDARERAEILGRAARR
jgi:hypothetical protein